MVLAHKVIHHYDRIFTFFSLAFEKLNCCLQGVQEWISSSILKLNPDKIEFIIFGYNAQPKTSGFHIPVRIFGNFIHSAVTVKNLGVWFDANFSCLQYL